MFNGFFVTCTVNINLNVPNIVTDKYRKDVKVHLHNDECLTYFISKHQI